VTSTYNASTGVWTASGAVGNVNALLAGLTFTPASNFNSNFTIATSVSDGVAAAVTGTKAMTGAAVNDAPSATNLSAAESYIEDTALNLTDIVVSDVDSASVTVTLTLSNTAAGSLSTATSGAVTSTYVAGTGVWAASGTVADVNTLLAGLTFTPASDFNGSFTIATSVSDGVAAALAGSKAITGTAVNDAPGATSLSAAEAYTEDTPLNLTDIVISDVDSASVTATLTLSNPAAGSLNTATSGAVTSTYVAGTGVWTASGALADVNTLLAGLTFTPASNFNSSFTIATSVSDGVASPVTGTKAMTSIAVNDAPSATNLSAAESFTEDTALNLTDIVVGDVDSASVTVTLTLSNTAAGSLNTATSGAVTSSYVAGIGVWTASGAVADVNTLLAGLTFTPASNFNSSFTIATSVSDGVAAAVTGTKTMTGTAANDAPSATNLSAAETYTEDTALNLTDIVVSDIDSASVTATLTLSNAAAGSLSTATSGAVTSTYNAGTGVWTASGAVADVNTLLANLTFTPAPNFNSNFTIATSVSDGVAAPVTGTKAVTGTAINDAPVITSSGGGTTAATGVAEDTTAVATVSATDGDTGASLTYTIVGGADAAHFALNSATGVLTFVATPNFEAPDDANGDNVYDVTVQVSDGNGGVDTQAIAVTVTNVNEAPVITSDGAGAAAAVGAAENQAAVTTVTSDDVDGGTAAYSIVGGADASRFTIDAVTGVLTFVVAPNFEAPADTGADNVYDVTVQVSDGNGGTDTQAVAVTVTNVNEAPAITSDGSAATASISAAENQTAVTTVTSSDVDGGVPSYSIVGGADAARFAIDSATGVLTFVAAPNFETPADSGADNVYDVTVQVADGNGGTDTQAIAVTVTNVNEAPVITSNGSGATASASAAENQTAVTTVTSSDVDGGTAAYSIIGGADAARFAIDSTTGVLTFVVAPDFESPTDAGADNGYSVTVQVSDGNGGADTQAIAVTVSNVNEAPVITSNGGAATAAVSAVENQIAVTTIASSDVDGGTATYSIIGGSDAAHFAIDSATGALTFVAAPNFEAPADAGSDNVYDVILQVADGNGGVDTQAIAVTVTNVNEAPAITSNGSGATASASAAENQTAVTTVTSSDVDGGAAVYSIVGGADAARFEIDSATGALTFVAAPDFESSTDAGGDNVYDVTVQVSDGNGGLDTQAIAVTVTNVNEAPVITSNGGAATSSANAAENQTAVTTVVSSDVDGGAVVYSISGGADAARFTVEGLTGVLTFIVAPDFEAAADAGADNVYDVTVQVSDGNGGTDTQAIAVTVTNVNEAPVITSTTTTSAAENQTAVTTVTSSDVDGGAPIYSIIGGADAAGFTIDATTGVLSFVAAPNFEAPSDAGGNNVYDVTVQASDGNGGIDTQAIAVTVTNVNEAPVVTSAAAVSVAENQTTATSVTSSDVDGGTPVYSIEGGADAALFSIHPVSGVLTFNTAPNFEAPGDAGEDNVYDVTVQVSDGNGGSDTRAIAVSVNNINEAPVIVGSASVTVLENQSTVVTVVSTDVDGAAPSYAIVDGTDAALFTIDAASGDLRFIGTKDFEAPADADRDNVYEVRVQVADGNGGFDVRALTVRITNVNEAPTVTSGGGGASASVAVGENQSAVGLVVATDPEGDVPRYRIVGGADAARFALDAGSGTLGFVAAPNFEAPSDADADNVYQLMVAVDDGQGGSDQQAISVTVTNINEAPRLVAPAAVGLAENAAPGTVVATVSVSDPDAGDLFTFTLVDDGGGRFVLDAGSGRILVAAGAALDFEAAAGHTLLLRVTDAHGVVTQQAIVVTLGDAAESGGVALPPDDRPVPLPTPIELPPVPPSLPGDPLPQSGVRGVPDGPDVAPRPDDTSGRGPVVVVDITNGLGDGGNGVPASPHRAAREEAPRVATVSFLPPGGDWSEASLDALLLPGSGDAAAPRLGPLAWLRGGLLDTGAVDGERPAEGDASQPFAAAVQDPVRVASATLTAGFVWWLTRSGGLLTSILMGIPAWRHVDLLPVLTPRREDDDDDESGDAAGDSVGAATEDSTIDEFFSNASRLHGDSRYL
jgi:hypothetical protein